MEAPAVQAQAATVQNLPPLKVLTGEGKQINEDNFKKWLDTFEERAKLTGWSHG